MLAGVCHVVAYIWRCGRRPSVDGPPGLDGAFGPFVSIIALMFYLVTVIYLLGCQRLLLSHFLAHFLVLYTALSFSLLPLP